MTESMKKPTKEPIKANEENQNRFYLRKSVYLCENIRVKFQDPTTLGDASCVDLSPEGMGVLVSQEDESALSVDQLIEVKVCSFAYESFLIQATVRSKRRITFQEKEYVRCGLQFQTPPLARNEKTSFKIQEFLQLNAHCEDPFFFSEPIFFRVIEFSPKGALLKTSLRNKTLIPGIPFQLSFLFPNRGEKSTTAIPLSVHRSPEEQMYYIVEVEFAEPTPDFAATVSEFLLISCPNVSLALLRKAGFFIADMDKSLAISYPKDKSEISEVLKLRLKAYHQVGKMQTKKTAEEMLDRYDAFSRHLVCKVGGRIIASMRIVFVSKDPSRSEHVEIGFKIPEFLWKEGFVEISRLCADPHFWGGDIMPALVRQAIRITHETGIQYAVANCNPELWPFYRSIGARKVGKPISAFGRDDCQLIYFRPHALLKAVSGEFLTWNQMILPVSLYVQRRDTRKGRFNPLISLHLLLNPAIKHLRLKKLYSIFLRKMSRKASNLLQKKR